MSTFGCVRTYPGPDLGISITTYHRMLRLRCRALTVIFSNSLRYGSQPTNIEISALALIYRALSATFYLLRNFVQFGTGCDP
jgi:hypothetical protein